MGECILNAGRQQYFSFKESEIEYPDEFIIVQETTCNVAFDSNLYTTEYDIFMYLDGGKSTSTLTEIPASKYSTLTIASQDMEAGYGTDIDVYIGDTYVGQVHHDNSSVDYMSVDIDISSITKDGILKLVNTKSGGFNSIELIKMTK